MSTFLRHIIFSILIFLLTIPCYSQGSMALLKGQKKQKLSFELINNLIIIPVTLNGKELSFILDSGARKTILFGSSKSDSLVLNNKMKIKIRGLGGGEYVNAIVSRDNRIQLENIYGYNQTIYVILNDKFDLTLKMGKPIHGIIGYEMLKNFIISINYKSRKLVFYNPLKYVPPKSEKYQKFALDFHNNKPFINAEAYLSDSLSYKMKFLLDTGCGDALWFFENKSTNLIPQGKFFKDYLGEGLSGSIEGKRTKIKSFKLGRFTFNNITTAFIDSVSTSYARYFKERDGSIGSRFLERFHVVLDYPHKSIYLKKAKSFNSDFRYNRAGLEIAYHKDAKVIQVEKRYMQKIKVSERENGRYNDLFEISYQYKLKRLFNIYYIRPDSPAEKAGLKAGDIIHKINGKAAYEYNLSKIINLLYGEKGETIKITVERKGAHFYYEFKLEKIF